MSVYYPSAQVTLAMRLDNFDAKNDPLKEQLESSVDFVKIPSGLNPADINTQIAELNAELREILAEPETPGQEQRAQAVRNQREALYSAQRIGPGARIRAVEGSSPDNLFARSGIVPVSLSISRNGYREADTATITLNWKDVPFDPRIVRSAAVEVILGAIPSADFAKASQGDAASPGLPLGAMSAAPGQKLTGSFTSFVGSVDDWSISYGDQADEVVLECRDFTGLMIDTRMDPNGGIDLSKPFLEGLREFIDKYPRVAGMPVIFGDVGQSPDNEPGPPGNVLPPQNKARKGKKQKRHRSGNKKMNIWDHITDVTVSFGFVPVIRDYQLRIIEPRTRLGSQDTPTPIRMVYGRNLEDLQFERKMHGYAVNIIELHCYNPNTGLTLWARYPTEEGQLNSGTLQEDPRPPKAFPNQPTPTGEGVAEQVDIHVIEAAMIEATDLVKLARQVYELSARQELAGSFTTRDISSWNLLQGRSHPPTDADLLKLRTGDPIELLIAPRDAKYPEETPNSTVSANLQARGAETQRLINLGWSESAAGEAARLKEAAGLQTVFRAKSMNIDMDHDDGIRVSVDFINYITVREEAVKNVSPDDLAAEVAGTPVSSEAQQTLGSREDAAADSARDAQKTRRATAERRERGEVTNEEYQKTVDQEREAFRGAGET